MKPFAGSGPRMDGVIFVVSEDPADDAGKISRVTLFASHPDLSQAQPPFFSPCPAFCFCFLSG